MTECALVHGFLTDLPDDASRSTPVNARRHGRVRCQDFECSLGTILDISASGMKVRTVGRSPRVGTELTVQFGEDFGIGNVHCVIRWSREVGLRAHVLGVEFTEPTVQQRDSLAALARAAAYNQ